MKLIIHSSGYIKDLIGGNFETKLELVEPMSIYKILEHLNLVKGEVGMVLINGKSMTFDYVPQMNDELTFIPMLTGG